MRFTTLSSCLNLNIVDNLFINGLDNFNESAFMERIANQCNLDFIVRISENCSNFASRCRSEKYRELWNNQLLKLASPFSEILGKNITFYSYPLTATIFDILKGEYFFLQSQIVVQELQKNPLSTDFNQEELNFLRKAIHYNSIHAIQRYNRYLYTNERFEEAINNCKRGLKVYGSYAYMMLAEAYFRYAQFQANNGNVFEETIDSAIKSCECALEILEKSAYSIHNASFGEGLLASNTLGFDNPQSAIDYIKEWTVSQTNKDTPKP